jgi:DNA-binding NarL/FixJ family response regulator
MESPAGLEPVHLFLVGLSEGFARSLARYVSGDPRVALTGVAPSLALAGMLLPATQPDLALLDWSALGGSPGNAVQALRLARPGLRIVCVANEAEPYRAAAAQAGADAVISKNGFSEELELLLRAFFPERFGASAGRNE